MSRMSRNRSGASILQFENIAILLGQIPTNNLKGPQEMNGILIDTDDLFKISIDIEEFAEL